MKKEYKDHYIGILFFNDKKLSLRDFVQSCVKIYRKKKGEPELILAHEDDWEDIGVQYNKLVLRGHVLVGKKYVMTEFNPLGGSNANQSVEN